MKTKYVYEVVNIKGLTPYVHITKTYEKQGITHVDKYNLAGMGKYYRLFEQSAHLPKYVEVKAATMLLKVLDNRPCEPAPAYI